MKIHIELEDEDMHIPTEIDYARAIIKCTRLSLPQLKTLAAYLTVFVKCQESK